jgi:transcriptional regulator with XRE-family HTH domain
MSSVIFAIFSELEKIMTLRETIKDLCKKNGISVNKLEKDLGFAKGYISKLDKHTPNSAKLQLIADYFNITLDFLMKNNESELSDRKYYINEDTAEVAQQIFENKDMQLLFKVARGEKAESLINYAKKLEELRKMEEGDM